VGEQTGPVSTVVIQVFDYLPVLSAFERFQTRGLSYDNDHLPAILNFSVEHQEFRRILDVTANVYEQERYRSGHPSLSFTAIADAAAGLQGRELLFNYDGGVALHRALLSAVDSTNGIGHLVLRKQRAAYTGTLAE
jgi:hypothetical protein